MHNKSNNSSIIPRGPGFVSTSPDFINKSERLIVIEIVMNVARTRDAQFTF